MAWSRLISGEPQTLKLPVECLGGNYFNLHPGAV
jgi:hypothetical protein